MNKFAIIALGTLLLLSCEQEPYLYRDISDRLYLGTPVSVGRLTEIRDSLDHSLVLSDATAPDDTVFVMAYLIGRTADVDREFLLLPVNEDSNVPPSAYRIGSTVLPAGAPSVAVPIVVRKEIDGLDLTKEKAFLTVRLVPNAHFLEGSPESVSFRVIWSNFLPKPAVWDALSFQLGPFSQARYKFILTHFPDIELSRYIGNTNLLLGLVSTLRKTLRDYNADPANDGRPEGWPYLDDNGQPLTF